MQEYNFNIFNLLIISGVLNGFIFSTIVLVRKKIKNNNFLAYTVLFLSLSNLQYFIIDANLARIYSVFNHLFIPWQWLIVPMFYIYVGKTINRSLINFKTSLYLLAPFFLVLAIQTYLVFYKSYINELYDMPSHFQRGIYVYIELFSFVFNIAIIFLTYKNLKSYERMSGNYRELKADTKWLKELIFIGLFICLCWFIALMFIIIYDLEKSYIFYPLWIAISTLVYWMGYIGIGKAQLLEERIALREQRKSEIIKVVAHKKSATVDVFNTIQATIESHKLYLNPDLSIESLATELQLNAILLSESINRNTKNNFNDYINSFRIAEAKKMLKNPDFSHYTIVTIGLEAGFNSKASFYRAFKKFEGTTPSIYLKN
jgi:AraC-like DNA-binding protein